MVGSLLGEMSARNEYSLFISDAQRQRILRGVVENYYGPEYEQDIVFDTNRAWCARMSLIDTLFPNSRVIACVRDMPWIVDSFEQLIRRNALSPSAIFNYHPGNNVYSRADAITNGDGTIGFPYNALKEAFYGEYAHKLLVVQYETLASEPQKVMDAVYSFIGEEAYLHDFDNVAYEADEFDKRSGTPGLHAIRTKVKAIPRSTVLPPDVFNRFVNDAFWRNPKLNTQKVKIV